MVAVLSGIVGANTQRRVHVVLGVRRRDEPAAQIVEQRSSVPRAQLPAANAAHRSLLRLAVHDALLEEAMRTKRELY